MAAIYAETPEVKDDRDEQKPVEELEVEGDEYEPLVQWVVANVDRWRTWRDNNYSDDWDRYERLWRMKWDSNDRLRESERSRIVSPALSEAVENGAAEIEEAVFGRGAEYFDIQPYDIPENVSPQQPMAQAVAQTAPPMGQPGPQMGPMGPMMGPPPVDPAVQLRDDVEKVRKNLKEDLGRGDFASEAAKCIVNGAVFGTGVGEIIVKPVKQRKIAKAFDGRPQKSQERYSMAHLKSVSPRNFVIDPTATSVDDALGVAVEEMVLRATILRQQREGVLRRVDMECGTEPDDALEGDQIAENSKNDEDKVHVIRYYGLVPTHLLFPKKDTTEEVDVDLFPEQSATETEDDDEDDGNFTEAVVIIGNKKGALKAVESPYVLGDRPIVLFPWDVVPGRIHGRGLCEKGQSSQRLLDAEIRARMDSLAYVTAPMMGMDVNRVPRGMKFIIKPGHTFLTNGRPSEIMEPFKFGQLDPNHFQNAQALQGMVAQATGSVDAAALAGNAGNARPGAVSMMMAPVIKRYKRTMIHFTDLFLMPALEKIAVRNMQFASERYPTVPAHFKAASTMGIMQREYETSQMSSLLAQMPPEDPTRNALLTGIVSNSTIPNREKVLKMIDSAEEQKRVQLAMAAVQTQDPKAEAMKQAAFQLEMRLKTAEAVKMEAEAKLAQAKAAAIPMELQVDAMAAATKGLGNVGASGQASEFDRRMEIADRVLEERKLQEKAEDRKSNERIAFTQMAVSASQKEKDRQTKSQPKE
jgi:hypothetical protein